MCYNSLPIAIMSKKEKHRRRAKGEGCLVDRNGIWYARWTDRGKTHFVSTGYRVGETVKVADDRVEESKTLAESFLMDKTEYLRIRHREDAIAMLIRQMQTPAERLRDDLATVNELRLGDLGKAFAKSPRRPDCSAEMLRFYAYCINHMADAIGQGVAVADVGDAEAEKYARQLRDSGMAASTYNKRINALTLAWKVCGREAGLMPGDNPWAGMTRRRSDAHVRRAFTREETDKILKAAEGEMRTLVGVLLYTGLRLGDACTLRWEDVQRDAVVVKTGKTGARVAVPITGALDRILAKARKADAESAFVMPEMARRYKSSSQGRSNVSRMVKRLLAACGIETSHHEKGRRDRPDATAHSFRHTFVSRAIEAGVPPHIVQAIVGHASAAMTERYSHLSDATVIDAFRRMG